MAPNQPDQDGHTTEPRSPGRAMSRESWDHQVHAFHVFGEIASTALCGHIAATTTLTDPPDYGRRCGACVLIREAELAAQHSDHGTVSAILDIVAGGPEPSPEPPSPHPGSDCGCQSCKERYGFDA